MIYTRAHIRLYQSYIHEGTTGDDNQVICSCALRADGPVRRTDTCILKHYCGYDEVRPFLGLRYNNCKL